MIVSTTYSAVVSEKVWTKFPVLELENEAAFLHVSYFWQALSRALLEHDCPHFFKEGFS